jgi:Rps23 Pro-64 3,4-dihydroxylase Tpa1-like proline 4-hydroxylase
MTAFALDPGLDPAKLAEIFSRTGRLQATGFLSPDSARALHQELVASTAWRLTANRGEQIIDFRPEVLAAFTQEDWAKLNRAIALGGRNGFQFCYETIRLPKPSDPAAREETLLSRFGDFMSSPQVVAFMREVTGASDIGFADAHASRYHPGHFLSAHDDQMETMGRRAAYVLNLTPEWRPDWGGLLLFHDMQGNIGRGFTPAFNVLNLFKVPQSHAVSWVTPLAAAPRYAVTGWLRAGEPS